MKLLSTLVLALCMATAGIAAARDYKLGSLHIVHPWTRATPKGASVGGGFLKITNNGTDARPPRRRLIADLRALRGPRRCRWTTA